MEKQKRQKKSLPKERNPFQCQLKYRSTLDWGYGNPVTFRWNLPNRDPKSCAASFVSFISFAYHLKVLYVFGSMLDAEYGGFFGGESGYTD